MPSDAAHPRPWPVLQRDGGDAAGNIAVLFLGHWLGSALGEELRGAGVLGRCSLGAGKGQGWGAARPRWSEGIPCSGGLAQGQGTGLAESALGLGASAMSSCDAPAARL